MRVQASSRRALSVTSTVAPLAGAGIKISMDGRRRWMDNVFIERLWRSLKYEDIYLKGYADCHEARDGIGAWMASTATNARTRRWPTGRQ